MALHEPEPVINIQALWLTPNLAAAIIEQLP